MAQTHTVRCIDDFLIHPTISHQQDDIPLTKQQPLLDPSRAKAPAATDNDMAFDFWPTYTSDEEATSPMDDDSASQYSIPTHISVRDLFDASPHHVESQCQRAQTVVIQSAGRARMVSLPKVLDPTRRSLCIASPTDEQKRPLITIPHRSPSIPRRMSSRTSQDTTASSSRNNSFSSAAARSPVSTAPSSTYDDAGEEPTSTQTKRVSRHIDLMQAARAINPPSPMSPMLPRTSTSSSPPCTPSIRRKTKFTTGLSLNRIGKTFVVRRDSNVDDMESVKDFEPPHSTPNVIPPTRYSSGRPKLVARAANERAPPIVLPPFPDE